MPQIAQQPHRLRCEDEQLTYAELNRKANQLAYRLLVLNARPEAVVALCFERGINLVVAILATLKAVSRKVHGDAGSFDIDLPLTGPPGIECRNGGTSGDYQIVLNCFNNVTFSSAAVIVGTGHVVNATGNGTNTVTVNVRLANAQMIQLAIYDLNDGTGPTNLVIPMGVLIGDINDNGTVNASDVVQTKTQLGQPVSAANFRTDVNPSGVINASDVIQVKLNSGTSLP